MGRLVHLEIDYSDVQFVPDISQNHYFFTDTFEYFGLTYNFTTSTSEKVHIG